MLSKTIPSIDLDYEVVEAEGRWTSIGYTDRLRVLKLVWTLRGGILRVVTALDGSKLAVCARLNPIQEPKWKSWIIE